ncbi:RNA polymerase sigma factor [Mucilaginibacter limnophilus]|uniref:RNA polymerase sigma factor n=1 Tax=Mucilaginibacter limnophilus TaxID=1932778 RepID=A0A3S2Y3J6_9SPHI|nr:RNA polymerase sigma factor [Mucilaginibacter limnophilus]RVU02698.1 RNA polymerase sigma factor [Mucilaginibacter limnophilus]
MTEEKLQALISGCMRQDRSSQKQLYKLFYGYAMSICLRYSADRDEAAEVMNQGFFKVFKHLGKYDSSRPFKIWLGRIMTNTAIDHYRINAKAGYTEDLEKAYDVSDNVLPDRRLDYNDLLRMVQRLPQAYRTVFNLFAIEGYTHEEIAMMLQISEGASKSNLHKARQKLKVMIAEANRIHDRTDFNGSIGYSPIIVMNYLDINSFFRNNLR